MVLKNVKPLWMVLAAAVMAIGAAALLHHRALGHRDEELADIDAEIERTARANAQVEQLVGELPELRDDVRRFARQMPPSSDLSPLIESVGTDPASDGPPEREIVTKPTIAGQLVARTPFSLRYRGSFRGTITFLRRLQEGDLFTRVERIVLERTANETQRPLRVQVEFSTFSRTSKELEKWAQAE